VARAALAGKGQHDLLSEAVQTLLATGEADRFGAWVELLMMPPAIPLASPAFAKCTDTENDSTPGEWSRLSPSPIASKLLVDLQTVEQELTDPGRTSNDGTLIEMRRALWVPLVLHDPSRVLFAGQRKNKRLPRRCSIRAGGTGVALELEDERP